MPAIWAETRDDRVLLGDKQLPCPPPLPRNHGINWILIKSNNAFTALSLLELGEIWARVWLETTKINSKFL